ncbi:DUF3231 family protein [Rossellomorea vietnamensis]|uniref:DUF3231 family protein n=1 Tax=Rossellomorea vietnamensis TaxID=218284 RepID=A0A5D4NQL6_9BACI|nr:DUF3231 family protein [Rossellomorea vietnamensis]TYS15904.1 DUF3231 family protein [Rossellomorea vietnamensis]
MENNHHTDLTSAEIAMLWNTYMADTMAYCILHHFLKTTDDKGIDPVIKFALDIAKEHIEVIHALFIKEELPIPNGFGKNDVNSEAPKLFSDVTYLRYIHHVGRSGLNAYSLAKGVLARRDVRDLYSKWLQQSNELFDRVSEIMLEKGVFIRSPYMAYPERVEYVTDVDFMGGIFGEKRPLLAMEVAHLGTNIEVSNVAKTLLMGFGQVAHSRKVSDYFKKGYDASKEHNEKFIACLKSDDCSYPSTWDSTITSSTKSPFSDKLMMFQISALNSIGMGDYGMALASSMRKDIALLYERLLIGLGKYADEGAKLMIRQGWFEKPPQTLNREKLRRQTKK